MPDGWQLSKLVMALLYHPFHLLKMENVNHPFIILFNLEMVCSLPTMFNYHLRSSFKKVDSVKFSCKD